MWALKAKTVGALKRPQQLYSQRESSMSRIEQLKNIIAHGYQNAPALRKLMDEAGVTPGDIQSVADLPKIPITTKDQLVQMQQAEPPFGGWLTVPPPQLKRMFISPGPIFDPDGGHPSEAWSAEAFAAIGIGPDDIVLNTFAYTMVPAGLAIDQALQSTGATVLPTGPGNTEPQVNIILNLGVTSYVGTPSFLKIIFEKAADLGVGREAIPIKKALFSAEPYPPSLRTYFEDDYGMITCQAYGTAELGFIAYDKTGEAALRVATNMIVEIADPETGQPMPAGETGQVVVTTFNETYPLVRLGTGDLSTFVGEIDNEGFHTHIKGWMGRVGDAVKVRGMFLHPLPLKAALAKFAGVGNLQAIVTRPDTRDQVRLRVEFEGSASEQESLREQLRIAASEASRLKVDVVEFVSPGNIEASARVIVDERSWD